MAGGLVHFLVWALAVFALGVLQSPPSVAEGAHAADAGVDPYLEAGGSYEAHSLAGQVLGPGGLVASGKEPGAAPAIEMVRKAIASIGPDGLILLGEVHDNGIDHRLRAALIPQTAFVDPAAAGMPARARVPAAVFEHIRADQQTALETFAAKPGSADDLFAALGWDKSGWPDKKLFAPLFETVISRKLPIYAGDPARDMIKKVAKEGAAALPEAERKRLGLDTPLPAASQEGLLDELEKSHCGLMPKTAFGNLAYAQRYRDASLADAVLKAAADNGSAILFAGNGHVRADRGVPWYIRQRDPERKIVTVMLVEVEDGKTRPEDYDLKGDDGKPIADYVVFTPRAERTDPCEDMKKMFEKRRKGG